MTEESPDEGSLRRQLRPSGPVSLSLTESRHGDATVIAVRGELDVLTAPTVTARLDDVVRRHTEDVVIDLRETAFIDSSGLSILLNTQRRLDRTSRTLTVVCATGPVRQVLELSRVIDTLGVVSSLEGTS
jgi:anti-sigma B factor antagonist